MDINYTIASSPLGLLLVAATESGLRAVSFGRSGSELEAALTQLYPEGRLNRNDTALTSYVESIQRYLAGSEPRLDLPVDVTGTPLEERVWSALRAIPYGATRGYGEIARTLETPTTAQEVAQACASNPVALVVPCHRVIRADGGLSGYRWGAFRKRRLLALEGAPGFAA